MKNGNLALSLSILLSLILFVAFLFYSGKGNIGAMRSQIGLELSAADIPSEVNSIAVNRVKPTVNDLAVNRIKPTVNTLAVNKFKPTVNAMAVNKIKPTVNDLAVNRVKPTVNTLAVNKFKPTVNSIARITTVNSAESLVAYDY